jgi:hypothetical protein
MPGQPIYEMAPMHPPAGIFLYHAPPLPPQKRSSTEDDQAPKAKKAKTKAKTTEGNGTFALHLAWYFSSWLMIYPRFIQAGLQR